MARIDVVLSVDQAILAEAKAAGLDLSLVLTDALRRYLDGTGAADDQRWAEENALVLEAVGGDLQTSEDK